jgi:hypothetical protein
MRRVADMDLDRVPDPGEGVRLLVDMNEAARLVESGFEVTIVQAGAGQDLNAIPGCAGLRRIEAAECGLTDGQVCHYGFEGTDSHPSRCGWRTLCTDPTACTVDWRLPADRLSFDISTTFVTLPPS